MSDDTTPDEGGNKPDAFTPITSQDELDRLIGKRIERERAKFSDYDDVKAKAAKFDEAVAANQTELEKATARAEAAERELGEFKAKEQRNQWVANAVKDTGVDPKLVRGSTKEEIEAHVADLKAALEERKPKPKPTPVPPGKSATDTGSRAVAALRQLRGAD